MQSARLASQDVRRETYYVEDDPDHQAATRTDGNILFVSQVRDGDFKAVSAWARVMVNLES